MKETGARPLGLCHSSGDPRPCQGAPRALGVGFYSHNDGD